MYGNTGALIYHPVLGSTTAKEAERYDGDSRNNRNVKTIIKVKTAGGSVTTKITDSNDSDISEVSISRKASTWSSEQDNDDEHEAFIGASEEKTTKRPSSHSTTINNELSSDAAKKKKTTATCIQQQLTGTCSASVHSNFSAGGKCGWCLNPIEVNHCLNHHDDYGLIGSTRWGWMHSHCFRFMKKEMKDPDDVRSIIATATRTVSDR